MQEIHKPTLSEYYIVDAAGVYATDLPGPVESNGYKIIGDYA